jgi:flagellin-like protein
VRKIQSRKAVSPVIATVILVAVAITVAVAVAYWMSGIAGQYTKFEKVEIQTAYSTRVSTGDTGWDIAMEIKNTGSAASTLIRAFVNDVPIEAANYSAPGIVPGAIACSFPYIGVTIDSGNSTILYIYISDSYKNLSSGTTVNLKLHSAGGMDYIKLVELV